MVEADSVVKEFASGRGLVRALKGVSLSAGSRATVVLLGKSGSGKTTLLNCLGGLERPDGGTIRVSGLEITSMSPSALSAFQRKGLGFVFQYGNLVSFLNAGENVSFPLALNGLSKRERLKRAEELLEKVGLRGALKAMPHELSGGETQRVALARALSHRPALLLADEPTASLDSSTGAEVASLILSLGSSEGATTIISTHDPAIAAMATAVVRLEDGRVV